MKGQNGGFFKKQQNGGGKKVILKVFLRITNYFKHFETFDFKILTSGAVKLRFRVIFSSY